MGRSIQATTARKVPLLVGCYTAGHDPLAYYTNTSDGAYVAAVDTTDGSLVVLDGPVEAGTNPTYVLLAGSIISYYLNITLSYGLTPTRPEPKPLPHFNARTRQVRGVQPG